MKIAKTSHILTPMTDWSQLNNGQYLQAQTQHLVNSTVAQCFGYNLLKLGRLSTQLKTNKSPIIQQINCAEDGENLDLQSELHHLPFQDSTIDLCILVHELDFSSDPHQLLREIDRVLTLDGTLIISGYNPYSLFGLRSLFMSQSKQTARLFSPNRVIDWLHLLGFEIKQKQHLDYISMRPKGPISSFIENIGLRYFPFFCSVYFIVAKKQCTPITPIKSSFEFRRAIINNQPVATKQSHSKNIT
ncbi:methyltransferase domain-containing protein [Psychromonas sp. RZ22]|uniref:class I SAM-dependent methyltransferase n=1 Tax=Psychromonas algarum TaxID=2555643 RepID=UPI001067DF5D|nr:methyltransferase domain-containing protein [Psychromonas sp. RZ22]TEW56765.1 methyltransferase domain-containing protein [Psychromonas sp. RZ22]